MRTEIEAAVGNAENGLLRLGVLGTGLELVDGHYEYVFQISHPWGCSWKSQRRYRDLLVLHEELAAQLPTVPPFPPKHTLSQTLFTSEKDIATRRIIELQRYLQLVVLSRGTGQLPTVQKALGVTQPKAPCVVRVASWEHDPKSGCASMELEYDLEEDALQVPGCSAPVESIEVRVRMMPKLGPLGGGVQEEEKTYTKKFKEQVRIPNLPAGREVEVKVCLRNIVGGSTPVAIQITVPSPDDADSGVASIPTSPSAAGTDVAPPLPLEQIGEGCRVSALWAGNGNYYDAVVRRAPSDGKVTVDWLRPAPLSGEELTCVCDDGGDDTAHRKVSVHNLRLTSASGPTAPCLSPPRASEPPKPQPQQPKPKGSQQQPQPMQQTPLPTPSPEERNRLASHDIEETDAAEVPPTAPQRKPSSNLANIFVAEEEPGTPPVKQQRKGSGSLAELFDGEDEDQDMPVERGSSSPFSKPRPSTVSNSNNLAEAGAPKSPQTSIGASGLFSESADGDDDDVVVPRRKAPAKKADMFSDDKKPDIFGDEGNDDESFDPPPRKSKSSSKGSSGSMFDDDEGDADEFKSSSKASKVSKGSKGSSVFDDDEEDLDVLAARSLGRKVSGDISERRDDGKVFSLDADAPAVVHEKPVQSSRPANVVSEPPAAKVPAKIEVPVEAPVVPSIYETPFSYPPAREDSSDSQEEMRERILEQRRAKEDAEKQKAASGFGTETAEREAFEGAALASAALENAAAAMQLLSEVPEGRVPEAEPESPQPAAGDSPVSPKAQGPDGPEAAASDGSYEAAEEAAAEEAMSPGTAQVTDSMEAALNETVETDAGSDIPARIGYTGI